jgi:glycosyl transferase family 1
MRFHYIAPSALPSRSANSVHVALQCEALVNAGVGVTLYAKRSVRDLASLGPALQAAYGISTTGLEIVSYFSKRTGADTLRIAAMATVAINMGNVQQGDAILSRNLYAAFALGVLERRPMIFETHQLERGVRKRMQRAIMTRPWVVTVAISNSLVTHLAEHHGVAARNPLVLPDAAADGIEPVPEQSRRSLLTALAPEARGNWEAVCGYFGHLYPGRGIEVIEAMAASRPGRLFLVYGGNDADVHAYRAASSSPNIRFPGYVAHPLARRLMSGMDVLLMPYQAQVSIGVKNHDTARWMSPMKMFEYLATGVPVVSSDLPALKEVLRDGENCILVPPDRPDAWTAAVDRLLADRDLARTIGANAHKSYRSHYSWSHRARTLADAASAR